MIYLSISVLAMVFNGTVLKWGETRGQNRLLVIGINYLCATAGMTALWLSQGGGLPSRTTLLLGPIGGVLYGVGLFIWMVAIARAGLGTSTAAMRLSVVWPTLLSIALFDEIPSIPQGIGIAFAFLAIAMLVPGQRGNENEHGQRGWPWLVWVFVFTGGIGVVLKIFTEVEDVAENSAFLALAFGTAGVLAWGAVLGRSWRAGKEDVLRGVLFGVGNMVTNVTLLMALESVPGTVAFPLNNSGIIVLTTLAGVLIWKEKPGAWGYAAIGAASLAIVLISL